MMTLPSPSAEAEYLVSEFLGPVSGEGTELYFGLLTPSMLGHLIIADTL